MQQIGIFAPSSVVGLVELNFGIESLREHGFAVKVLPQVKRQSFTFAGTDEQRAGAMFDLAKDSRIDILWAARGGYGAQRMLPLLAELTKRHGKPEKKLLIGYSDITVLHEFARQEWGWDTLHAPMPSASNFSRLDKAQWENLLSLVRHEAMEYPASDSRVRWMANKPASPIRAELVGGNLSLWQSLVGTPFSPTPGKGRILFFEDVDERLYRLDRMIVQISQAGLLDRAKAIVLGDFTNCDDEVNTCLAPCNGDALKKAISKPDKAKRQPLRKTFSSEQGIREIFVPLCERLRIPLARGLPVGHGPSYYPLPLGAQYELSSAGQLKLLHWNWSHPV
ncbi:MAG TPA: LD-carboxypeptidase [Tepidisphaeraceae bacterium]|jgi:muramoyltetrapeptide carboxypeptidase